MLEGKYSEYCDSKVFGKTYTPHTLSSFIAKQMCKYYNGWNDNNEISIFDPAVGDGNLILSLLAEIRKCFNGKVKIFGCETDLNATNLLKKRITCADTNIELSIFNGDFFEFASTSNSKYDLIIANPPYVRIQLLTNDFHKRIAKEFQISGRFDLYYLFLLGLSKFQTEKSICGIITSNKFLTVKSGNALREQLMQNYNVVRLFDLGDTKLFSASVLPAVLLLKKYDKNRKINTFFSSVYSEQNSIAKAKQVPDILSCIESYAGYVELPNKQVFKIKQGILNISQDGVWRNFDDDSEEVQHQIQINTWKLLGDIVKIRVGVKTTADKVFISDKWEHIVPVTNTEIWYPLITHRNAAKFSPKKVDSEYRILYPYELNNEKRTLVNLNLYPNSKKYLEENKVKLSTRKYLTKAGREWYEIWVPQNPKLWNSLKIVFRDISETPMFWLDKTGSIINGDCYWMSFQNEDMMWLVLGVANSSFIEEFYDLNFSNKLYSNKRRFMAQYVEKFPIPNIESAYSRKIIQLSKTLYNHFDDDIFSELNNTVYSAFGLSKKL